MAFPPAKNVSKAVPKKPVSDKEPDPMDADEAAEGEATAPKKPKSIADLKAMGDAMAAKKIKAKQGA